jgi:hypothetical protein
VTGAVAVVVGGVGGVLSVVAEGVATTGTSSATAAGRAAASEATSGLMDTPPLPFIPGGTGPGAEGVGKTPVRYACAHPSTIATYVAEWLYRKTAHCC